MSIQVNHVMNTVDGVVAGNPAVSNATHSIARQVRGVLEENLWRPIPGATDTKNEFNVKELERETYHNYKAGRLAFVSLDGEELASKINALLEYYTSQLVKPFCHFQRLDRIYGQLLDCAFRHREWCGNTWSSHALTAEELDVTTSAATAILARLPTSPPVLEPCWTRIRKSRIDDGYLSPGANLEWDYLLVVQSLDNLTIKLAISMAFGQQRGLYRDPALLDTVSKLLVAALQDFKDNSLQADILRAFLWSSWSRLVLLMQYQDLVVHLEHGYQKIDVRSLHFINSPLRRWAYQQASSQVSPRSEYMCSRSFWVLRQERSALIQDFRAFHARYAAAWDGHTARCFASSNSKQAHACTGTSPTACERYIGTAVPNQSAHAAGCDKATCRKLLWSKPSYMAHTGGRAVSLQGPRDGLLWYCKASPQTMAISHVWLHGQGGRPDLPGLSEPPADADVRGFNQCLHERYARIAQQLGCDSYWMDTPCIPDDRELRMEAISHINDIFSQSRVTLISDMDLMLIDVISPTIEVYETLLVTLLVSDWNQRAWTALESLRGRNQLYLLCKNDHVVRFKDVLQAVVTHGNISIAVLFLTAAHLLPANDQPGNPEMPKYDDFMLSVSAEKFASIEDAAGLLRYRQASHPDKDEIVIWSLLCEAHVSTTAEQLWQRYRHAKISHRLGVRSGFLMSSIPRLQTPGFSWAPSRPSLSLATAPGLFPPDDGTLSQNLILGDGRDRPGAAYGTWKAYRFADPVERVTYGLSLRDARMLLRLRRMRRRFNRDGRYRELLMIHPTNGSGRYELVRRSDLVDSLLVAVVGCDMEWAKEESVPHVATWPGEWTWLGVYEWTRLDRVPIPKMQNAIIQLV